jgi:hypothetical protein
MADPGAVWADGVWATKVWAIGVWADAGAPYVPPTAPTGWGKPFAYDRLLSELIDVEPIEVAPGLDKDVD